MNTTQQGGRSEISPPTAEQRKRQDWRIGLAVTPKMRTHPYFGQVGVVRRIFPETPNTRESMEVELFAASGDPLGLHEPTDEWMTA